MAKKNLTVTYRKFDHLDEFTPAEVKRLRKLTYGENGCMAPVIDLHTDGYCQYARGWRDDEYTFNHKAYGLNRHIMVAYIGKTMIGWTVNDLDNMFNVFVAKRYRKLGIAQKLTELWASRNVDRLKKIAKKKRGWEDPMYDIVHTDDALKLMRAAMTKLDIFATPKKYRKVVHKVIG